MPDLYKDLKKQLIRHEGLRLAPYQCTAGKLTIGVGRNLDDNGITEEEAMMLLDADIANCAAELTINMPWWNQQPVPVKQVLLNMAFNLGLPTLMQFRKFLTHLQTGELSRAAEEMLDSKWARQVGGRAVELSEMVRSA